MVESPFNNVLYTLYSADSSNASGAAVPDEPPAEIQQTTIPEPDSAAPTTNSPGGFPLAASSNALTLEPLDPSRPIPSGPSSANLPITGSTIESHGNSKISKKRFHRKTRSSDVVNGLGLAAPPGVRDTLGYDNVPWLRGGSRQSPRRHRRSESLPGLGIYQQGEEGSPRMPTTSAIREPPAERQRRRSLGGGPSRQLQSVSEVLTDYSLPTQPFHDPQAPSTFNALPQEMSLGNPPGFSIAQPAPRSAPPWIRRHNPTPLPRHEYGNTSGSSQWPLSEMGGQGLPSMFPNQPLSVQPPRPPHQQSASPALQRARPIYGSPYMQDRWPVPQASTPSASTPSGQPASIISTGSDPGLPPLPGSYAGGSMPGPMMPSAHAGANIMRLPSAMGISSPLTSLWDQANRPGFEEPRPSGSSSFIPPMQGTRSPRMSSLSYTAATAVYGYSHDREGPRAPLPPHGPPGFEFHSYSDPASRNMPGAPFNSAAGSPGQSTDLGSSGRQDEEGSSATSARRGRGGRVTKHRRARSRTTSSRRGTLARALETSHYGSSISAPTFIPGVIGADLSVSHQQMAPPGGFYWGLRPHSEEGSPQNPIPVQLCEPPLADCVPPNPGALIGDPEPRARRKSKYTAEQDQKILDLKTEGKAWHEIAALTHCQNTLAARNRYQVLIGQQGGGTFFWTREDCEALQQTLDEGERAKWYFLAQELSKRRNREYTMDQCHYQISAMFAADPSTFSVIKTKEATGGGAPMRRQQYKPSEAP